MVDRVTEIREALDNLSIHAPRPAHNPERSEWDKVRIIERKAARAYADLLESGALIISRDENGDWQLPQREGLFWASDLPTIFDEVQDEFNCQRGVHDLFEFYDDETEVMCDNCGVVVPVAAVVPVEADK